MKKVITIEPAKQVTHKVDLPSFTKRRVAGYARVSTDHEDQTTSYEAQMTYYTDYINSRSDWEFVKMYSDEGISGTNTKKRLGFQEMVEDALDGKVDLILTKSVSRFARNTVDSLSTVRKLKEAGVEIYFEKENIWTFDSKGELLITIMSSLAQEESRSISENVTWGRRRQLAEGQVTFSYSQVLGFKKSDTGGFEIDQEEAKIVRYIFHQVLLGNNPNKIARELTAQGIPTPQGKRKWSYGTVKRMLRNEKYKGDALLQKSFTTDFLTKSTKPNEGELPQYYVENNHEAIIKREVFDLVQVELDKLEKKRQTNNIFTGRLFCGDCGSAFGSKVWHSTSKYKRTIYQCNAKYKGEHKCQTP
ncbi:TPA: recombinase family protein, partial [Streptococcus agalactiae]